MGSNNGFHWKSRKITGKPLFRIGLVVGTPGAEEVMRKHKLHPLVLVSMHASGIWGEVPHEDGLANEAALENGDRIMSVYHFGEDRLWIITEADRSVTTILTPDEY